MSDSGRSLIPFVSNAINVLDPRYGAKGDGVTDDTGAIQSAINAASARAASNQIVDVWLPSGYGFFGGPIQLKSQVRLWAYGAVIKPNLANIPNTGVGLSGLLATSGVSLNRVEVRGGTWLGSGAEGQNQFVYYTTPAGGVVGLRLQDMYVPGWATAPLFIRNSSVVRVLDNEFINVNNGAFGSFYNVVDLVSDTTGAQVFQNVLVRGNVITGTLGCGVDLVINQVGNFDLKTIISDNIIITGVAASGVQGAAIGFESANASVSTYAGLSIIGNDCQFLGNPAAPNACFSISPTNPASVQLIQSMIKGNRIQSTNFGIRIFCSDVLIEGNRIIASSVANSYAIGGSATPSRVGNVLNGGPISGKATLVAGTVTVSTPEVQAGDNIILNVVAAGGTRGIVQVGTITAGTGFVINSIQPGTASTLQASDTSTVYWRIDH